MDTVLITGNTYPVKDQIKALGGHWDADAKGWRVPADKASQAQALVDGAPVQVRQQSGRPHYTKCQVCGVKASRYVRIYGSGECRDCYEERKMGY
jgi:hypothetical protein